MRKAILTGLVCLGMSGAAFAAEPPAKPMQCCCEKMKEEGKECCPEKGKGAHEGHGEHAPEAPKS